MNSLNSVLIEGNLTKDVVVKQIDSGTKVCTFGLASNRYYKQGEEPHKEVSFFEVESWAKLAENCAQYLKKGRGVRVVGRLKQDRWQDGDGATHSRIKIVAEHVEFRPAGRTDQNGRDQHEDIARQLEQKEPAEAVAESP